MRHHLFRSTLLLLLAATQAIAIASPQRRNRTVRYPRVYGATGRPYGPTQAHYQYQRQYGRPWQGGRGSTARIHRNHIHTPRNTYYFASSLSAWQVYGSPYTYNSFYSPYIYNPPVYYPAPVYNPSPVYNLNPDPFYNSALRDAMLQNQQRWNQPLNIKPLKNYKPKRRPKKTTTKAKIKSIRAIASGDRYFKQQDLAKALGRYRDAVRAAPDYAQARFRLGLILATTGKFTEAVKEIKVGLKLDISWPITGQSLGRIFGRNNALAKSSLLGKATRWAGEDIRDPDRLFLIGVLLYFDSETDKAETLFETAYRLAGKGDHLIAFLRPVDPADADPKNAKKAKKAAPPKPKTLDELLRQLKQPDPKKAPPKVFRGQ